MRKSTDWMTLADDRILEYLATEGPATPDDIAADKRIRHEADHLARRARGLEKYRLVEVDADGVYRITDLGEGYLDGEVYVDDIERK